VTLSLKLFLNKSRIGSVRVGMVKLKNWQLLWTKVTVQRTSYTVLMTYFFFEGVIYIILNKLVIMHEDEYDSEGTARSVVAALNWRPLV
jgi:hypothetical protein